MKREILLAAALCAVATAAHAVPNTYLGSINTAATPLAIAADADGRIYYTTFKNNPNTASAIVAAYAIADASAAIGQAGAQGVKILDVDSTFSSLGRGLQGIAVSGSGTNVSVFVSGDLGAAPTFLKKYTGNPTGLLTEDTTFGTATAANANRQGGLALIGSTLVMTTTFNSINFFQQSNGSAAGLTNVPADGTASYQREVVFNPRDNVAYAFRNGQTNATVLLGAYTGISPTTGGGAWTTSGFTAITTGASNTAFGTSIGHGFYYTGAAAADDRLYIVETSTPAAIREFSISNNGLTLTATGSWDATLGPAVPAFTNPIGDIVRVGNRYYLTSFSDNKIHVYEEGPATDAQDWSAYE